MTFWTREPRTPEDHLRLVVGHHAWATESLLDCCTTLTADQLALSSPGAFGSIIETLDHLVRADAGYQRRLLGRPRTPRPAGVAGIEELRAEMREQVGRWEEILAGLGTVDVIIPAEPEEDPPYPEVHHASGLVLTQAIHHGNEHRTNVSSILAENGLRAPELSAWEYIRVMLAEAGPA